RVAVYHIMAGLSCLWRYLRTVHRDFHDANVLYLGAKGPGAAASLGVHEYARDTGTDHVPFFGHLFVLWDFQYAYRERIIDPIVHERLRATEGKTGLEVGVIDYRRIFCLEDVKDSAGRHGLEARTI